MTALLGVASDQSVERLLEAALRELVELCEARKAYLELTEDGRSEVSRWTVAHGCTLQEQQDIATAVSRGIIGAAVAEGRTVVTASAMLDARFRDQSSVQSNSIEAVLCTPIRRDTPMGVLYLEGRREPGPFGPDEVQLAEIVAGYISVFAELILARTHAASRTDFCSKAREGLKAEGIIGRSQALGELLKEVSFVAPVDVRVLLTGESGTGKSQIARVIHDSGPRAAMPFVELNCAALPDSLFENELFGSAPGAHSTATRRSPGKLEAACRGTLFLDEIGELSLVSQAKLLQFLQSGTYFQLGANTPRHSDVRIIAATNRDLNEAVRTKTFRQDLLYRLDVMSIRVPSLEERRDDIEELAQHFCRSACQHHRLPILQLSRGAITAAKVSPWPGNVRQLQHAVEAAVIRAAGERVSNVEQEHLFPREFLAREAPPRTLQAATRNFQTRFLTEALERNDWNVSATATEIDVARSHLYALIRSLHIRGERTP